MEIGVKEIELIVQQVIQNMDRGTSPDLLKSSGGKGDLGVFELVDDAVAAAHEAQRIYVEKFQLSDRNRIINAIREVCSEQVTTLARMVWEETSYGRYEDKLIKHRLIIEKTPGPECLKTEAITGDNGLMLEEPAPFGVIGAITPVTNPTETIINNTISMLSGGNSVVFNVHPASKNCCAYCVQLLNKTIVENGGPENLVTMVKNPTMDTVGQISGNPKVRLMVGTGGMGMVNALLRSGKKVIGAGAGNPPVIVDETADIHRAAEQIYMGASFDNNILCFAEKEIFVMEQVADELIQGMKAQGAYLLDAAQMEKIRDLVLTFDGIYHANKKWVGQDAGKMLREIGVTNAGNVRLLIIDADNMNPFVSVEQLMPVLPIVRCKTLDEAIERAVAAEGGNRHTASMFSKDVNHMTKFAKKIETTIFVKNSATLAGLGYQGEGHSTMTIAGPTGEGITCATSFTRKRRCVLSDGGFRII